MCIARLIARPWVRAHFACLVCALGVMLASPVGADGWVWTELDQESGTASSAEFGGAVALDGDLAVVGAAGYAGGGAMHLFQTSDGASWNHLFTDVSASTDADFGASVAVDGQTVVVGAPGLDAAASDAGAVYVYTSAGGTWSLQAVLQASDADVGHRFGAAVAIDGDTLIVGTDPGGFVMAPGAAYVFTRSGSIWTEDDKLMPSNGSNGDKFGAALDLEGNTLLVGARAADPAGDGSGAAYVFVRSGGAFVEQAMLQPSTAAARMSFGSAVALEGSMALIGAENTVLFGHQGSAFIFTGAAATWTEVAVLNPPGETDVDLFGHAVAFANDPVRGMNYAIVGAMWEDHGGATSGSAYIWGRQGNLNPGWAFLREVNATDSASGDSFGSAVDMQFDAVRGRVVALIGALGKNSFTGKAYFGTVDGSSASVASRTGGNNMSLYSFQSNPVLGGTFRAQIDLKHSKHSACSLVGYATPAMVTLPGGRLLLVNINDPGGELLSLPLMVGPVAFVNLPVPPSLAFMGVKIYTQAMLVGPGVDYRLTNSGDLTFGW